MGTRLQARLDDLRRQEPELSLQAPHEPRAGAHGDELAVADHLDQLIADAEPHKAKALLRLLIEELRVNGRREILPTCRLATPTVCAMSEKVELIDRCANRKPVVSASRLFQFKIIDLS